MRFLCDELGMRVLRHEEFKEGCEAQCNGPYDGRWSKTMVGYGPECDTIALEITYNYTHKTPYTKGDDLVHIDVRVTEEVFARLRGTRRDGAVDARSPEGYVFRCRAAEEARIAGVRVRARDAPAAAGFYEDVLNMSRVDGGGDATVAYGDAPPFFVEFMDAGKEIEHAEAGGRLAVAVRDPAPFENLVKGTGGAVHTSLVVLDTPGKASVSVVILTDLDNSEICVVNDDGFSDLSRVDAQAKDKLWSAVAEDKSR